jgi:hypothetical protein
VTGTEGPDDARERLHAPDGGDGFDASPSTNGFDGPERAAPVKHHAAGGNGHPAPITAVPGTPIGLRGRWIVPLAVVSAMSGMALALGWLAGTVVGRMAGLDEWPQLLNYAIPGAFVGAVAGVWGGSWLAIRLTGQEATGRLGLTGLFGTMGLVAGIALAFAAARTSAIPLVTLGMLAPGFGAALGDRIALGRKLKGGSGGP